MVTEELKDRVERKIQKIKYIFQPPTNPDLDYVSKLVKIRNAHDHILAYNLILPKSKNIESKNLLDLLPTTIPRWYDGYFEALELILPIRVREANALIENRSNPQKTYLIWGSSEDITVALILTKFIIKAHSKLCDKYQKVKDEGYVEFKNNLQSIISEYIIQLANSLNDSYEHRKILIDRQFSIDAKAAKLKRA